MGGSVLQEQTSLGILQASLELETLVMAPVLVLRVTLKQVVAQGF